MNLKTEPYLAQRECWPQTGRHILAQFDEDSVVVYQAYRPEIGDFAANYGYFGGAFSLGRMSWIKPNFLWMMYRCGWATKEGQEVVLAVRLKRPAFDTILSLAVHSSFDHEIYASNDAWKAAVEHSNVRLQWDPDHAPASNKMERRAIQLGMRGEVLASYARDWIISIEDIAPFAREQHKHVLSRNYAELITPAESVYPVADKEVAARLGMS